MKPETSRAAAFAATTLLLSTTVCAHHSGAMFDDKKSVTLEGTVRQFQWTNPHCWIQLTVAAPSGPVEWSIEMGAPSQLFQAGWRPSTLKFGDKIRLTVHPARDGAPGAVYVSGARLDGQPLTKKT